MVGLTETSKRTYLKGDLPGLLLPVPQFLWWAPADPLLHRRTSNNSKYFWFSLLWGHCSFPLDLSACKIFCPPRIVCFLQSCISPIIKCRWYSRWIPWLGSLIWGSEPSQQWKNYFGIIVIQFVGHPPSEYVILFYCDCAPSTILLWLLCVWIQGIFFWWVLASSHW